MKKIEAGAKTGQRDIKFFFNLCVSEKPVPPSHATPTRTGFHENAMQPIQAQALMSLHL